MFPTLNPFITTPYRKIGAWIAGFHTGTDFGWRRKREHVRAPYRGIVRHVGQGDRYYGTYVVLYHPDVNRETWLCHLVDGSVPRGIKVGKRFHTGRRIGLMGQTGNAFGKHLHHEERTAPFGYNDHAKPILFAKPAPRALRLAGWR